MVTAMRASSTCTIPSFDMINQYSREDAESAAVNGLPVADDRFEQPLLGC